MERRDCNDPYHVRDLGKRKGRRLDEENQQRIAHVCACPSIYLSVHPSVHPPTHLPMHPSIHLSICLSVHQLLSDHMSQTLGTALRIKQKTRQYRPAKRLLYIGAGRSQELGDQPAGTVSGTLRLFLSVSSLPGMRQSTGRPWAAEALQGEGSTPILYPSPFRADSGRFRGAPSPLTPRQKCLAHQRWSGRFHAPYAGWGLISGPDPHISASQCRGISSSPCPEFLGPGMHSLLCW